MDVFLVEVVEISGTGLCMNTIINNSAIINYDERKGISFFLRTKINVIIMME
jgi:hypothetical protein